MLDERTTSTTGSAADLTASVPDDPQPCRADGTGPPRHHNQGRAGCVTLARVRGTRL